MISWEAYNSGIGKKASDSSFSSSSSVFAPVASCGALGGSHDAIRRWDLARAREARLKTISDSDECLHAPILYLPKVSDRSWSFPQLDNQGRSGQNNSRPALGS